MSGTLKGGKQAATTNTTRHGANYYARIGAMGGKAKHPLKGFGTNRELAHYAGSVGGMRSRRGKMKMEFKTKEIERAYRRLLFIQQKAERERNKRMQRESMVILQ